MCLRGGTWTEPTERALTYDPREDNCLANTWHHSMVYAPGGYHRFYRDANDGLKLSTSHAANPVSTLVAMWLNIPTTTSAYTTNLEQDRRRVLAKVCALYAKLAETEQTL